MSGVSAEDNITFENDMSAVSSDIDEQFSVDGVTVDERFSVDGVTVDVDGNMASSDVNGSLSADVKEVSIEMDENPNSHVKLGDSDEGEFIDVSEAYELLNAFRTEENVWQWNSDDKTKSYFNTNDTIWLQPLERDIALEETAKIRAKDLVEFYSHTRPNGDDCFSIFPEGLLSSGENIAIGFVTCADVTEAWKETDENYEGQGHRRNMLFSDFNSVGIAAYKLNGYLYWVQDFGLRNNPKDFDSSNSFHFSNNTVNPEFSIEVPKYAAGSFIVNVNGNQIMSKSISNGKASIVIYGLSEGTYTVELSYGGDYNYKSINKTVNIYVPQDQDSPDTLSFSHLNTLIKMNPYEVKLEKDYAFNSAIDSDFIEGIFLSEYVTIDGQGHRIDGNNQARAFIVGEYGLTFMNLNFTNCNANSSNNYGGAIYSFYYAFNVMNSSFSNNHASLGGAIYSEGTVDLKNSSFISNHASDIGGAVFTLNVLLSSNSTFINNTNTQIYVEKSFTGTGNAFLCDDEYVALFINATRDNGIVSINQDLNATQTIVINGSNVIIDGNGHTIDGLNKTRLFYVQGDNVTIRNINIINGKNDEGLYYGGAILADGELYVVNSSFRDNEALGYGGAISVFSGNKLHIINSTFTNDTSRHYGGAINGAEWVEIINSTFELNSAEDHGGVISLWGELLVDNCSFTNNSAFVAGAIFDYCIDANVTIKSSDFTGNIQNRYGTLYLKNNAFVENSAFINNTCTEGTSGAICNSQNLTVMNCTFANNSALTPPYQGVSVGGAIVNYGEYVSIGNSTFTNNSADKGGAVANFGTGLTVENSTFTNNSGYYGGAIYNWYGGNASVSNSTFECNFANVGGAIINDNYNYMQYGYDTAVVTVKDSRFNNNSANYGGAIYNCNSTFILINSTLVDNNASVAGTIYDWRGLVNVINSSIINSYVIFNATEGNVIFNNSRITENGLDVTQDYINHNRIQYNSAVNADSVSVVYGNPVKISVSSLNASSVIYNISREDGSIVVEDTSIGANGTISCVLSDAGYYIVHYRTVVDPYHLPAYSNSWVYVSPAPSSVCGSDIGMIYGDSSVINVSSVNATGVIYSIWSGYGGSYVVEEISMAANGTISDIGLDVGYYIVYYRTVVDGNHESAYNSSMIYVYPASSSVNASDVAVVYGNPVKVSVSSLNATGVIYNIASANGDTVVGDTSMASNGTISLNLAIGEYVVSYRTVVDGNHESVSGSSKITVNPASSSVNAGDVSAVYGNPVKVSVSSVNATGVIYNIASSNGSVVVGDTSMSAKGTISGLLLAAGEYVVNYRTVVDANHKSVSGSSKITVRPASSRVSGSDIAMIYGDSPAINVSSVNATGVVYNVTGADGKLAIKNANVTDGRIVGLDLAVGEYIVSYRTIVDGNHESATNSSRIVVSPAASCVSGSDVSVANGNPISIKVSSVNATGVVYNVTGADGTIVIKNSNVVNGTISGLILDIGEYVVNYRTVVDGNHRANASSSKIIVKDIIGSKLKVFVNDIIVGQSIALNFTLLSADNANINGSIDVLVDKHYNVTVKNGKGSLSIPELPIGAYEVIANYGGDSSYDKSNGSAKFNVNDRIGTRIIYENMNTAPVPKSAGRIGNYFCVKLVDENNVPLAGVPIKIGFNAVVYNKVTDSLGDARLQINLVREDLYTFAISFLGDDEYQASFEVAKIDVNKKHPKPNKLNGTTTATEVNKTQKETRLETSFIYQNMETESVLQVDGRVGKYFKVKLVDNNKKPLADMPIKIGFNGVIYNKVTNSTGEARLQINLLRTDVYTFAISYLGDTKYQASFAVAKITVNPHTPKLTATAKKFKATAKTKTLSATLKSSNGNGIKGKRIVFRINGRNYAANTNSKGVASVKISLTKKGTYTATAKFAGDSNIKATSRKFTVKII